MAKKTTITNPDTEWNKLLEAEKDLYYVTTGYEVMVYNNKFGFKKDRAEKLFGQCFVGLQGLIKDPELSDTEKKDIRDSILRLAIYPLRYH